MIYVAPQWSVLRECDFHLSAAQLLTISYDGASCRSVVSWFRQGSFPVLPKHASASGQSDFVYYTPPALTDLLYHGWEAKPSVPRY